MAGMIVSQRISNSELATFTGLGLPAIRSLQKSFETGSGVTAGVLSPHGGGHQRRHGRLQHRARTHLVAGKGAGLCAGPGYSARVSQ